MKNQFETLDQQYLNKPANYYGLPRKELLPFLPNTCKTLLDVGCGGGGFGFNLKNTRPDLEIWGIEPHQEAGTKAAEVFDKVLHTTFDENTKGINDKKFDCITFNDVLEHLIDPAQTLELSKKYLSKDGYVMASIPNILFFPVFFNDIILKQDWEYQQYGTLDNTHLRFFTKKSIVRMFENAGFDIVTIEGINPRTPRRYRVLNALLFNKLFDWRFLQFVVVAKKKVVMD
jgi:2-polyprenyl-3-methyl-5-hydroxy-6-metoxy-1,4-benzoquinol methylase